MGRRTDRHGGRNDGRRIECAYKTFQEHTLAQADPANHPDLKPGMAEMTELKRQQLFDHRRNCFRCQAAMTSLSLYNAQRGKPLRVPHWYFGGAKFFPGVDWPELKLYHEFIVKPDDTITPDRSSGLPRLPKGVDAAYIGGREFVRAPFVKHGMRAFRYDDLTPLDPETGEPLSAGVIEGLFGTLS